MFLAKKNQPEFHNGAILIIYRIIKHVMSSVSKAQMGEL